MRINLASVVVDDQEKVLRFYMDVLGFVRDHVPVGERAADRRSPDEPDGPSRCSSPKVDLRPSPSSRRFDDGIPTHRSPSTTSRPSTTACARWRPVHAGAVEMELVAIALVDETCGNLIQIASTLT